MADLHEFIQSQKWEDLMKGIEKAYKEENKRLGAKQWQEFFDIARNAGRQDVIDNVKNNIGQLRQWLNEDRITDPKKMVTNEQIAIWILTNIP